MQITLPSWYMNHMLRSTNMVRVRDKTIVVFPIYFQGIFIGPGHLATMEGSTVEPFFELYINITC